MENIGKGTIITEKTEITPHLNQRSEWSKIEEEMYLEWNANESHNDQREDRHQNAPKISCDGKKCAPKVDHQEREQKELTKMAAMSTSNYFMKVINESVQVRNKSIIANWDTLSDGGGTISDVDDIKRVDKEIEFTPDEANDGTNSRKGSKETQEEHGKDDDVQKKMSHINDAPKKIEDTRSNDGHLVSDYGTHFMDVMEFKCQQLIGAHSAVVMSGQGLSEESKNLKNKLTMQRASLDPPDIRASWEALARAVMVLPAVNPP